LPASKSIVSLSKDGGYKQKEIAKELSVAISTVSNYDITQKRAVKHELHELLD
jgi:predicted transcriptional regulator